MYQYGKKSLEVIDTVNEYLQLTALETIKISAIDMSIAWWGGLRTAEIQKALYDKGWSRADGVEKKSFHQMIDSKGKGYALDLCAYVKGKQNWNEQRLVYLSTIFGYTFNKLKKEGRIPKHYFLHQGIYWTAKGDGMGWDLPHNEIRFEPQKINLK